MTPSSPSSRSSDVAGRPTSEAARDTARYTRAERAAQIERLDRQGLTTREIADRLGLARSTVNIYRADPDGERQGERRQRYQGACANCGRPTSASGGPNRAPERCRSCAGERRRNWSEQRVLEAIRDWAEATGSAPALADWSPAHAPARHEGSARYRSEPGRWPGASTVTARFGSLRGALERAGLHVPGAAPGSRRVWTRGRIVQAVRRWERETGQPPRRSDWQQAADWHPAASTVYRTMGSWRAALRAAGIRASRRRQA